MPFFPNRLKSGFIFLKSTFTLSPSRLMLLLTGRHWKRLICILPAGGLGPAAAMQSLTELMDRAGFLELIFPLALAFFTRDL